MVDSGWSVRIFEANNYSDEGTIDHLSNFKKGKSRQLDTLISFNGIYGIDNYLIWHLHKDMPIYDFSTVALDVSFYMYKSTKIVSFQDFYRVRDVRYNPNKSQYTLYAVSESTEKLHSKLISYDVKSLSYKENRTAKDILKEVLQDNNIFYVVFHDDNPSTKTMVHYEYRYFDIDPEWTVLDFIEYIADDNQYEWCIDSFVGKETNKPYWILHIGHELKGDLDMNATKPLQTEIDNISESIYAMKITTNTSSMLPLSMWEDEYKCVWCKHTVGKGGGLSRGCFVPTGLGHLDKHIYLSLLEGNVEKHIAYSMLNRRKLRIPSIGIGNILKDEGLEYIDEISIQKNPKTYSVREPHNIIINRGDDLAVQHQLERTTRWSPYLDHNSGLLFPSPKLDNPPPNSLIFNVGGKRESAVMGGYVYGNGREEYIVPIKNKQDFRMQFPNGWCLYVKEEGDTILQVKDTDPGTIPSEVHDIAGIQFYPITEERVYQEVRIIADEHNFIDMFGQEDNGSVSIFSDGIIQLNFVKSLLLTDSMGYTRILLKESGEDYGFRLQSVSGENFIIETSGGNIDISASSGTININTTGTVNVGASASAVNIAGGGKKLSHGTHTHKVPAAIPGPPQITEPTTDNTIKTEAD